MKQVTELLPTVVAMLVVLWAASKISLLLSSGEPPLPCPHCGGKGHLDADTSIAIRQQWRIEQAEREHKATGARLKALKGGGGDEAADREAAPEER